MSEASIRMLARPRSAGKALKSRLSAAERRRHLIGVALRLFATRGFSGTTTKAIAEAAGVSEAIIFRHFSGKEALYLAILREQARQDGYYKTMRLLRGLAARNDDEGLIFHLVLRTIESFERDPDFHRLLLYAALEGHPLAKVSRRVLGIPLFKLLLNYVKRRQKAGGFRPGRPELIVFGILALPLHFAMITKVIEAKRVEVPSRDLAEAFTRLILDGVESAKPDGRSKARTSLAAVHERGSRKQAHGGRKTAAAIAASDPGNKAKRQEYDGH